MTQNPRYCKEHSNKIALIKSMSSIKPRYCKKNRANQEYLISVDDRAIPRFAQIEGALIEVSLYCIKADAVFIELLST